MLNYQRVQPQYFANGQPCPGYLYWHRLCAAGQEALEAGGALQGNAVNTIPLG